MHFVTQLSQAYRSFLCVAVCVAVCVNCSVSCRGCTHRPIFFSSHANSRVQERFAPQGIWGRYCGVHGSRVHQVGPFGPFGLFGHIAETSAIEDANDDIEKRPIRTSRIPYICIYIFVFIYMKRPIQIQKQRPQQKQRSTRSTIAPHVYRIYVYRHTEIYSLDKKIDPNRNRGRQGAQLQLTYICI